MKRTGSLPMSENSLILLVMPDIFIRGESGLFDLVCIILLNKQYGRLSPPIFI
jgi:hypothetical protein